MTLTLEQVLARALRLPSKRVNKALFQPGSTAKAGSGASHRSSSTSDPKEMLELMRRIEVADDLRAHHHLKISTKAASGDHEGSSAGSFLMIRNNQDLLSHLNAAKRMGTWEDALSLFAEGKKMTTITPNVAHLRVLADTLCSARKTSALVALLNDPAAGSAEDRQVTLAHATSTVCKQAGWEAGLEALQIARTEIQTTDAFNEVIAACSRTGNWESCLRIVHSMGPSIISKPDDESTEHEAPTGSPPIDKLQRTKPPSPDAVSFAALVSVLQETNRQEEAKEILLKLPAGMREIILTSTVALIHVWSEQRSKQKPRGS
jgi:pentatricopeptide repeat protein